MRHNGFGYSSVKGKRAMQRSVFLQQWITLSMVLVFVSSICMFTALLPRTLYVETNLRQGIGLSEYQVVYRNGKEQYQVTSTPKPFVYKARNLPDPNFRLFKQKEKAKRIFFGQGFRRIPARRKNLDPFRRMVTPEEYTTLHDLAYQLDKALTEANLTYMLYSGSLLGAIRHNDMIPWDDDIDLFYNASQAEDVLSALNNISEEYVAMSASDSRITSLLKFFHRSNSTRYTKYSWAWPGIDMFGFEDIDPKVINDVYFNKLFSTDLIFPLARRKFGDIELNVPHDSRQMLGIYYGRDCMKVCKHHLFDHRLERQIKLWSAENATIDCAKLHKFYHFARNHEDINMDYEEVKFMEYYENDEYSHLNESYTDDMPYNDEELNEDERQN